MAQGTGGVIEIEAQPPRDPRAIEEEIVRRRGELGALVGELNLRRHELADVKLQVRRHPLGVAVAVLAMAATAAGAVALATRRARRRNTLIARRARLRKAMARMIDRPERVAVEPTITERILASAGSAVAVFVIKAALERFARPRSRP
jgi:hypothetical protein